MTLLKLNNLNLMDLKQFIFCYLLFLYGRYRRVASSSCEGGQLHKYSPVEEDCPLLAPRGLSIYCAKTCIQRGKNVTFTLTQESVSWWYSIYCNNAVFVFVAFIIIVYLKY